MEEVHELSISMKSSTNNLGCMCNLAIKQLQVEPYQTFVLKVIYSSITFPMRDMLSPILKITIATIHPKNM